MYEGKMYDVRFMYEGDAAALIWGAVAYINARTTSRKIARKVLRIMLRSPHELKFAGSP
jgi:hypothetical protein